MFRRLAPGGMRPALELISLQSRRNCQAAAVTPVSVELSNQPDTTRRCDNVVCHPFLGTIIDATKAKALFDLGFEPEAVGSARLVLKRFPPPNSAVLRDLKRKGSKATSWQAKLVSLMESADLVGSDVVDVVNQAVRENYENFTSSCMPPKLESLHDPQLQDMNMTPDQVVALEAACAGYNMYIGGSAGTGKTVLLKAINRELSQRGVRVAVTATTGVAAVHLGGCTFHHAFGVPMSKNQKWDYTALRSVDAIIIDEVSLLDDKLLLAFHLAAQTARLSNKLFGGIQVIACGDFLQLTTTSDTPCYLSPVFQQLMMIRLVSPLRHKVNDPFYKVLSQLRTGFIDAETIRHLSSKEITPDVSEAATFLFPKRRNAMAINDQKLASLSTEERVFAPQRSTLASVGIFSDSIYCRTSSNVGAIQAAVHEKLLGEQVPVPLADIVVMSTRNSDTEFLIRIRIGNQSDEKPDHTLVMSKSATDAIRKYFSEPGRWEKLARTVIIPSLSKAEFLGVFPRDPPALIPLSVSSALADFEVETMAPLRLKIGCRVMVNRNLSRSVSNGSIGHVEAFSPINMDLFPRRSDGQVTPPRLRNGLLLDKNIFPVLPIVRLTTGEILQIPPVTRTIGGTAATFYYGHDVYGLPLQLGYAFTVHKVQGLTMETPVVLDCCDFFECPHLVYVAMSRVKRVDQLYVRNLTPSMISVSGSAKEFAESIPQCTSATLRAQKGAQKGTWVERMKDVASNDPPCVDTVSGASQPDLAKCVGAVYVGGSPGKISTDKKLSKTAARVGSKSLIS